MAKEYKTAKERKRAFNRVSSKNYKDNNADEIKSFKKRNYEQLKDYGYNSKERSKMQHWSMDKIKLKLLEDGKL